MKYKVKREIWLGDEAFAVVDADTGEIQAHGFSTQTAAELAAFELNYPETVGYYLAKAAREEGRNKK